MDLLDDVVKKSGFTLLGNFRFVTGYSAGWTSTPLDTEELEDMALLDMSSYLTLDFQVSPEFRVLQKYGMSFPSFDTTVTEFFGDYSLADRAFFRIGRQNLTWGTSRYFAFTNLTARVPDDFGDDIKNDDISDADSYAFKLDIPVSVGGIQALAYTRNGYFEDSANPATDEIGFGGNINLAGTGGDLTLGTFYHKDLNWRGFYSFSKTVFGSVELYHEAVISYDIQNDDTLDDEPSDRLDAGANLGFFWEGFDKRLALSGEYFYCGEETELDIKNSTYPLFWGHNFAGSLSWKTSHKKLKLFSQFRYNAMDDSGVIIPGATWDAAPNLTLNFLLPTVWGNSDGGYYEENPLDLDKPVCFIISCVIFG